MLLIKSLLKLIGSDNQIKLALLQVLFLITSFFQVAGIVSIAPFITMISNSDSIQTNLALNTLYNIGGFASNTEFMIYYAIGVVILLLVGNAISSYTLWKLFKISMQLGAHVQRTVYESYLDNDYTFFSMNNSSELISKITQEIPRMVYMVVQPLLLLISQLFISIMIIAGLLLVDVTIAFFATLLVSSVYLLIFKTIRSQVVHKGRMITALNREKLKYLNESIAGIKEVKLIGNENYYKQKVDLITLKGLSASAYIALAGDLPKFVVETVVFSSILGLSIYILSTEGTAGEALSIISLYAMAGYKLLPAAQQIYKSFSQIRANASVVIDINDEINKSQHFNNKLKVLGNDHIDESDIVFHNVSFRYPKTSEYALLNCSFEIKQNTMTAFVGSSGAGKSTAVDILLGLILAEEGYISIGGKVLGNNNIRSWRDKIGYVPQDIFLLDASLTENIAFGVPKELVDEERLIIAAKLANIYDFIVQRDESFGFQVGERGGRLSGGQRQRIGIARALYKNPSVLVFDEATSALDNVTERNIMTDILKLSKTRTVILIAHRLTTVEQADNILVFKDGAVISNGNYNELSKYSVDFKSLLSKGDNGSIINDSKIQD